MDKGYIQHEGRIIDDKRFGHMMALTLDPTSNYTRGVIRCIKTREGDGGEKGSLDTSDLYQISGDTLEHFIVEERLEIKNEKEIVKELAHGDLDFLGLEDPDIWIDEQTGLTHLYFTMPFVGKDKDEQHSKIHLGHAVGKSLDSLEMTMPVLRAKDAAHSTAKEVSIAPISKTAVRNNLFESSSIEEGVWYSTVRVGVANDMGAQWGWGETVFHPAQQNIVWAGGHASPGPFFSKEFIDVGESKVLGFLNGRQANRQEGGKTKYGVFSIGLYIYDYEKAKIDWVSPQPFIIDSQAKTITFASQLVERGTDAILYAHVDDSFVRAYTLTAKGLKELLPK